MGGWRDFTVVFRYYQGDRINKYEIRIRRMRDAYNILVGKPGRKKSLERPRGRWKNDIKVYLGETGFGAWTRLI